MSRVGIDVGTAGRLFRLILGVGILFFVSYRILQAWIAFGAAIAPAVITIVIYFAAILAAYLALYWLIGKRVLARDRPWINTLLIVGPPYLMFIIHLTLYRIDLLLMALLLYISISLILSWKIRYGGCEMVSIPIIIFRQRCTTYCIPIVVVDVLERRWAERKKMDS